MSISETPPPAQLPAKKTPLWRRALRGVGWMLAGLFVLVVVWSVAQVALRRPRPALLFTEADFPKIPAAEENGWDVLKNEIRSIGEPQRPEKEVTELCDAKSTVDDRWSRVEARAQKLSDIADDDTTKRWLTLVDKVAARPRFADACPITIEPDCPRPIQLLALHQMQEAVVLQNALVQRWDDAFVRATKMLRVDIEFLPSARSTLSQAVARAHVHRSVKLVGVLLDGAAEENKQNRGPEAARVTQFAREVSLLLQKVRDEDMAPIRAVIAEYLFSAYVIEHLTDFRGGQYSRGNFILYDPGHTLEMANERFEQYKVFARDPHALPVPKFPRSKTWFLRNPIGHLALEVTRAPLENHLPTITRDNQLLMQDRAALLERLAALTNPP